MKTWKQYCESREVNWKPSARIGYDPLISAIKKITQGKANLPFSGNFTDSSVIQSTFGLDDEELASLQKANLIIRNDHGYNIDRTRI